MDDEYVKGILLNNDQVLMWDSNATRVIRTQHKIIGSMIGALPSQPRQSTMLGMPLLLLPEETTLLMEKGILSTYQHVQPFNDVDHTSCKQIFEKARTDDAETQLHEYQKQKKAASEPLNTCSSAMLASFSPVTCVHTKDPLPVTKIYPNNPYKWAWPTTVAEKIRYAVFHDLRRNGYYITSGLKYGGDYLVYSGDPALVHSKFIATVISNQDSLSISRLVGLGRLGTKVKKNTLICSVDEDSTRVTYYTLQWTGWS